MIRIHSFIDKLEDKISAKLSRHPRIYAFVGSIGIVLIWRGIWVMADNIQLPGWVSLFIGVIITSMSGLFVSFFIGDSIIMSGIKREKRIDEKTEEEIIKESEEIKKERIILTEINKDIKEIKKEILSFKKS